MVCFRQDCPRAARIKAMQAEAYRKGLELLGDPRVRVTVPVGDGVALNSCAHPEPNRLDEVFYGDPDNMEEIEIKIDTEGGSFSG